MEERLFADHGLSFFYLSSSFSPDSFWTTLLSISSSSFSEIHESSSKDPYFDSSTLFEESSGSSAVVDFFVYSLNWSTNIGYVDHALSIKAYWSISSSYFINANYQIYSWFSSIKVASAHLWSIIVAYAES